MNIFTKLRLIREGYSFEEIDTPGFDFIKIKESVILENDVHIQNLIQDMQYISETSIDYIMEANQSNFGERVNKIIQWLKNKISQFIQFIKTKFGKKAVEAEQVIKETDKAIEEAKAQDKNFQFSILVRGYEGTFDHAPFKGISAFAYFVNCHSYSKILIEKKLKDSLTTETIKNLKEQYRVNLKGMDFDNLVEEEVIKGFLGEPNSQFTIDKAYYNTLREKLRDNNKNLDDIWRRYLNEMNALLDKCRSELTDSSESEKLQFITKTINNSIKVISLSIRIVELENNDIINILNQLKSLPKKVTRKP